MLNEQSRYPNNYQLMEIFTDPTETGDIAGYAYQPAESRAWRFESLVELLMLLDTVFDIHRFPQSTHDLRSMTEGSDRRRREAESKSMVGLSLLRSRKEPDFKIKVSFRQQATWQGTLTWVAVNRTAGFDSSLELIRLIDSAVNPDEHVGWGAAPTEE